MPYLVIVMTAVLILNIVFISQLRNGLVRSCERNGNPLRNGLREEKMTELNETRHPNPALLRALHITMAQAVELSKPRIKQLEYDIDVRYAPINCPAQYPKVPLIGAARPPPLHLGPLATFIIPTGH